MSSQLEKLLLLYKNNKLTSFDQNINITTSCACENVNVKGKYFVVLLSFCK